jgi:hypothetical protein
MTRHSTNRWDGTVVVECPNGCISLELTVENSKKPPAEYVEETYWDECPKCGAETGTVSQKQPTEVLT